MSKCRANSPAVFSPPRNSRSISRRVGSASALKASFMCMAGTALVRQLASCLNNKREAKKRQGATVLPWENDSGESIVGDRVNAKSGRGGRRPSRQIHGAGGEIEPLLFPVAQRRQANPMQDRRFVAVEVEDDGSGGAIEEEQPTLPAFAANRETPDAMTG